MAEGLLRKSATITWAKDVREARKDRAEKKAKRGSRLIWDRLAGDGATQMARLQGRGPVQQPQQEPLMQEEEDFLTT